MVVMYWSSPLEMKPSVFDRLSHLVCSVIGRDSKALDPDMYESFTSWIHGSINSFFLQRIITKSTAVQVPPYVINQDLCYFFPNPEKFWLERWLKQDLKHHFGACNAFISFSIGSADCPGKRLAMIKLRLISCLICVDFWDIFWWRLWFIVMGGEITGQICDRQRESCLLNKNEV